MNISWRQRQVVVTKNLLYSGAVQNVAGCWQEKNHKFSYSAWYVYYTYNTGKVRRFIIWMKIHPFLLIIQASFFFRMKWLIFVYVKFKRQYCFCEWKECQMTNYVLHSGISSIEIIYTSIMFVVLIGVIFGIQARLQITWYTWVKLLFN